MNLKQRTRVAACLSIWLLAATTCVVLVLHSSSARAQTTPQANSQNAPLKDQIALHEQQLAEAAKAKGILNTSKPTQVTDHVLEPALQTATL